MQNKQLGAQIQLELSQELLAAIDNLKDQLGLRTRKDVAERILNEVFLSEKYE